MTRSGDREPRGDKQHPANRGSAPEVGAHQTVASGFVIAPQTEGAWKEQPYRIFRLPESERKRLGCLF